MICVAMKMIFSFVELCEVPGAKLESQELERLRDHLTDRHHEPRRVL